MVLPYDNAPKNDKLRQAINKHCEEDSTHHYMLWEDLAKCQNCMKEIGVSTYQEAIKFLWGTRLHYVRKLGFEIARLAVLAEKLLLCYCIIRVMEELGEVFFNTVVGRVKLQEGNSQYLGQHHLDLENGCLQGSAHGCEMDDIFEGLEFDNDEDRNMAKYAMMCTYKAFDNMLTCTYKNMSRDQMRLGWGL